MVTHSVLLPPPLGTVERGPPSLPHIHHVLRGPHFDNPEALPSSSSLPKKVYTIYGRIF
jgi:hypothetical protein